MSRTCKTQCCPNGFCGYCKPKQIQQQMDTVKEVEKVIERKNIPYGYACIYPGNKVIFNINFLNDIFSW